MTLYLYHRWEINHSNPWSLWLTSRNLPSHHHPDYQFKAPTRSKSRRSSGTITKKISTSSSTTKISHPFQARHDLQPAGAGTMSVPVEPHVVEDTHQDFLPDIRLIPPTFIYIDHGAFSFCVNHWEESSISQTFKSVAWAYNIMVYCHDLSLAGAHSTSIHHSSFCSRVWRGFLFWKEG